ncbi:iron uptake porin [Coleofasciculus sp. LEGE 07092]|uniref:iron uptake porin n=2 Tax=unclassified Coleofasciculus TaxID=2692782 RepID=UPI002AD5B0E9|nr:MULTISPECIES: iron uptake porin [unclassified Coleofasciculus]
MKTRGNFERKASSALLFATLGCLVANVSSAQAATVESLSPEFPASTDLSTVTQTSEIAAATHQATVATLTHAVSESAIPHADSDTGVDASQQTAQELATLTPTDSAIELASPLSDLEISPTSTDGFQETNIEELREPEYLQVQSLPEDLEISDPNSIESIVQDPLQTETMDDPMGQVTNVSQLRDVSPGDWAYEALRSLVERYGCIAGYPDGTFRGNRAMTRYEFAAGLNACLQQIDRLLVSRPDLPTTDLESLRRLVQEFEAEIATLGGRVDNLEGRVGFLEDNQFSTTTKLFGQAIFGLQGRTQDNEFSLAGNRFVDRDTNITLIDNVQLSLFTQLSPRSLLLTSFQAGNGNTSPTFSDTLGNYVRLGYEGDNDNDLVLSDLSYRQLLGSNFAFIVGPEGVNPVNVFRGVNRIESAGSGPLSSFAQRNPIINVGNGSGGVGFDWQVATRLSLQAVYSASTPANTANGIFGGENGETSAGVQLVASPTDNIDVSLQYINAYSPFGRLGTGVGDDQVALRGINGRAPISTNAFGAGLEWRVTPRVTFGGWAGYTISDFKADSGDVETLNWMAFLNFPDLFGEGNLGGIYVGQPPRITSSDLPNGRNVPSFLSSGDFAAGEGDQPGTTTHVEAFYRFRVADNISITPGVIVIFNPLHNDDNDTITIGAIRTTFTF